MIELRRVTRGYGEARVLDGVDLHIVKGDFVALLGSSGSGKTTLLRLIAGLDQADSGQILIDGSDATATAPSGRGVGFVFQSYALFGHMSVAENIAFGLRVKPRRSRPAEPAIRETVQRLLAMVQLEGLGPRRPAQLSGGQRQRVALARALAVQPRILLLDEPFGALDRTVRLALRDQLRQLHAELGLTIVLVSHDQEEAESLATRLVRLEQGRIV